MKKPTVFFSHSSKDAAMVMEVKRLLDTYSGGTIEIFLSSDGQSIPFGRNWVHRIEEALEQTSIMFVFITPESLASSWIYFEAGFAYSKGNEVVPIGIGIDIALLKPPLSLLQGFNITSEDGLNNLISIMNRKFEYHFEEKFSSVDFKSILLQQGNDTLQIDMKEVFRTITFKLHKTVNFSKKESREYDIEGFWEKIGAYLNENRMKYTINETSDEKSLLVYGIRIVYKIGLDYDGTLQKHKRNEQLDTITFTMSPYYFEKSFSLFQKILQLLDSSDWCYLHYFLTDKYQYLFETEHLAAVFSTMPDEFSLSDMRIGEFIYYSGDIRFAIVNPNKDVKDILLIMIFNPHSIEYFDIQALVKSLINNEIIKLRM